MKQDSFDRALMEEMSQLPPDPQTLEDYTPWQFSIRKIMCGMALNTIRLEFFYLQYLLPLLGAVLLYLGCRSLRKSDPWFRLCWISSGFLLVVHMSVDILTATPLIQWVTDRPILDLSLASALSGVHFLLLVFLRAGIRRAFTQTGQPFPKDWLGRGLIAYLLSIGVALWSELVPATQPAMIGYTVTNDWLYYGRPILFLVLEVYLLSCILRQSEALAGRGYDLVPAPVRLPGSRFLLAVFALVLLAIPLALFVSSRLPVWPATEVTAPLAGDQAVVRERLIALGLPEDLAYALDQAELERCAQVQQVIQAQCKELGGGGEPASQPNNPTVPVNLGDGQAELSVWIILLPGQRTRILHFFHYTQVPSRHLQNQFSVDPSGYFYVDDFAGGLLWDKDGATFAAQPQIQLGGGETSQEVPQWIAWIYQAEFDAFGRRHYSPWFNFAIPSKAEHVRGYLAYTVHPQQSQNGAVEGFYGDVTYLFLRHQSSLLHYPFASISDLGGQRSAATHGSIQTVWATFDYFVPVLD